MHRITVIVFRDHLDMYSSSICRQVLTDFASAFRDDLDEECRELPKFSPVAFYKKLVWWFEYKGDYYVFISARLTQQELGRVEHCIYTLTGLRGTGIHITNLEFLCTPNTPMKKFLLKRV